MQYSAKFTIAKKDTVWFNLLLLQKKLITHAGIVAAIVLVVLCLMRLSLGESIQLALANGIVTAILGALIYVAFSIFIIYRRIGKMYKTQQLKQFVFDIKMDREGVRCSADGDSSLLSWNQILAAWETPRAFYLFLNDVNAKVLPKDQMKDAAEMETVRSVCRKYMDAKRLKLKK